jgi:hypothetical protein
LTLQPLLCTHPGLSRFHEGFQVERAEVDQPPSGKKSDDSVVKTVLQAEQGVTTVDWNPNLSNAGWHAIAWASALARVQYVTHGT